MTLPPDVTEAVAACRRDLLAKLRRAFADLPTLAALVAQIEASFEVEFQRGYAAGLRDRARRRLKGAPK